MYSGIQQAESGTRGYVATGQQDYIQQQAAGIADARDHFRVVQTLIADNPQQERNLDRLALLNERKTTVMQNLVALRRDQGFADASQELRNGEGLRLMNEMRAQVDVMKAAESALLQARQTASRRSARVANALTALGTLLAVAFMLAAAGITRRDSVQRQQAEQRLRASEERYRTLFDSIDEGFCTIEMLFDENQKPLDYRFLEINPAFERQTGIQNARGRRMREIAPLHEEYWFQIYGKIAVTGEPARFENQAAQLHRWYDVYAYRIGEPRHQRVAILFNDITERKRAETALQESEAAFRTLAESVPQMVWMCTPDGLNIYFNQRWVDYTGLTLEESYGRGWNTPFHPDDKQPAWNAWNQATATGNQYQIESRLRAADGSYRWFLMRGEPLRDAAGHITKWFGTCTDIDDLKRATEGLRHANAYNRSLLEASLDPLVTISPDGKITDINEATVKVTGAPREKLVGTDFANYFTEPEKAREGYRRVFSQGFVTDYPLTIRHVDGRPTDVLYNASVYKDAAGSVLGVFAAARDVTALKQASEYARSLLEASLDPLVTIAPDGEITDVNKATEQITGLTRQELVGTDFSDYFTDPQKARAGYQQAYREGSVQDYELEVRHRDGHRHAGTLQRLLVSRRGGTSDGRIRGGARYYRAQASRGSPQRVLRRAGAFERRSAAVRLRSLPRPAGTAAHGGELHATAGQALPRKT